MVALVPDTPLAVMLVVFPAQTGFVLAVAEVIATFELTVAVTAVRVAETQPVVEFLASA